MQVPIFVSKTRKIYQFLYAKSQHFKAGPYLVIISFLVFHLLDTTIKWKPKPKNEMVFKWT